MSKDYLFENINVLIGPNVEAKKDSVLIYKGVIREFGDKALKEGKSLGIRPVKSSDKLLAPCLVDPHSFLETTDSERHENIESLSNKAALGGYGQIALLPRSSSWRDKSDVLQRFKSYQSSVKLHTWGSFSLKGEGKILSCHQDLLQKGAIGLAEDDFMPPIALLRQGFLLGEIGSKPVLIAARDKELQGKGMVRESVEALRAGWVPDPVESEVLPLCQLLELHKRYNNIALRLMNLSTERGLSILSQSATIPSTTVGWWHLLADNSNLCPYQIGWSVVPSLGTPNDRKALINGLKTGLIKAIAVNSTYIDDAENKQPVIYRKKGLSGYQLVLPLLWKELIIKSGFSISELWEKISFGPSKILKTKEEKLAKNSNRWLLYDPYQKWVQKSNGTNSIISTNQPFEKQEIEGKIIDCGLSN